VFTVSEIKNVAVAWLRLEDESEAARDFSELEEAAKNFGHAIGGTALRVLVMLATIFVGKALPSPKAPAGGGPGGMAPAPAGGPRIPIPAEAVEIKVMADGSIVVLGPKTVTTTGAMMGSKGGGGGGTKNVPEPPKQKMAVKEEAPPEGTQGVKEPRVKGPD